MAPVTAKYTGQLRDKRILIVGGTSGIGYSIAEAALEHHAVVTVVGSNPIKLKDAVSRLEKSYPSETAGGRVRGIACDLADSSNLEDNAQKILAFAAETSKINHIVITAADMTQPPSLMEFTVEKVERTGTIRYMAPLMFAKHLPRFMDLSAANSLTLTSGAHAHKPDPGWTVISGYCGAVESMAKGLAIDLQPLRVNVVSPGAIMTDVVKDILGDAYDIAIKMAKEKSLVASAGTPENIAQAYLYLMKDQYVSGTVLESNGGMFLA
ncbi:hypothetical protein P175DRAFT_0428599 [Aspergillus ochraceoroseus IBT 24754]|uniref:Short-chain dehydrogenase n=3 Tax=Aspergillus subgen. Nidulantes TaxID=2720870 RepID=A0A0F8U2M6_9EURO|nr:uncharacterized protein P175DRAFT_0428599 [Aspergillus ochraceoroseus IBT 24754]KKK12910.1 hypothetical protein AOCH_000472 [Aspergillus ochraceoroseus]KKK13823.1 hypothetical protein ARAM_001594 [Aspergillus rambellii]PTU24773.1 hypothetical protein P175DRAFT_0428599 [Aspergillus ochraceoroseus IBT 24754]